MSDKEIISKAANKLDDVLESLNQLSEDQENSIEYAMNSIQVAIGHLDEASSKEG